MRLDPCQRTRSCRSSRPWLRAMPHRSTSPAVRNRAAAATARDDRGSEPPDVFARNLRIEGVKVLLEHNADTNSRDSNGKTPLYLTTKLCMTAEDTRITRQCQHSATTTPVDMHHRAANYVLRGHIPRVLRNEDRCQKGSR